MTMECIVGPPLSEVLIGQVVLERLDLIADCTNRTLTPRYEDYPLLKLKALGLDRDVLHERSVRGSEHADHGTTNRFSAFG